MNERLKELRKALNLTQQGFADIIGVKRNTVATYEIGRNEPIDAVIKLICDKFNVNEGWLRTGEGEMFLEISRDDELMALINKSMHEESGEIRRRIATAVMNLSPEQIRICTNWIKDTFNLVDAPKEKDRKIPKRKTGNRKKDEETGEEASRERPIPPQQRNRSFPIQLRSG